MTYLFDTNAFIAWWHELYQPAVFEDVAELITQDIQHQIIQSPVKVRQELEEKVDDELTEWVKKKPDLFIPFQVDLQNSIRDIEKARKSECRPSNYCNGTIQSCCSSHPGKS